MRYCKDYNTRYTTSKIHSVTLTPISRDNSIKEIDKGIRTRTHNDRAQFALAFKMYVRLAVLAIDYRAYVSILDICFSFQFHCIR